MVIEGKEKEVEVKEEKNKDERERCRDRVDFAEDQEGMRCKLSLDEEPDVGTGSNVSNCTLLVHGG